MSERTSGGAQPFVIWTLQRTGGTNLARRLFEASGLPGTDGRPPGTGLFLDGITDPWKLHEPFNYGDSARPFGFASAAWVERRDRAALDEATETICRHRLPLKHCVEMVPWEVSESLAHAALRHDYRHVFLFRRQPLNRLLSVEYARRSGVWGPNLKGKAAPDDVVFAEPLDAERLTGHERYCSELLGRTWQLLSDAGESPLPLAFEDVYQCDDKALVRARLFHLLTVLRIARGAGRGELVDGIVGSGDQGTRDRYEAFAGIEVLSRQIADSPLFTPPDDALKLQAHPTAAMLPAWINLAVVDHVPAASWPGDQASFGGVVVLSADAPADCALRVAEHPAIDSRWRIDSPLMATRFPAARNRATARYCFDNIPVTRDGRLTLQLLAGDQTIDLFTLTPGPLHA